MKTAVVTGASGGIGLETARALLADGWQVVCLSRHACPLEGVRSIPCDITDSAQVQAAFAAVDRVDLLVNNAGFGISGAVECTGEAEMRRQFDLNFFAWVTVIQAAFAAVDRVDLLVNNAGFGISGAVECTGEAEMRRQFDLNFFAWVTVIQAALPALRESRGRILNISSAAAVFSIPFQSFYSATKAAVESLTCALRSELAPFGITVGALRLGDVKTGFTAARQKSGSGDDLYAGRIARSVAVMERDEQNGMPPAAIAAAVVRAAHKKHLPPVTTVGIKYKLLCGLNKLLPLSVVTALVAKIYIPEK